MLAPELIPDTTRSGRSFRIPVSEVHAVRRGAAHRVDIPRHLGHPERQLKREGVARSRLVMLGAQTVTRPNFAIAFASA